MRDRAEHLLSKTMAPKPRAPLVLSATVEPSNRVTIRPWCFNGGHVDCDGSINGVTPSALPRWARLSVTANEARVAFVTMAASVRA